MDKILKVIEQVDAYEHHSLDSPVVLTLCKDDLINYRREKLRNGIVWFQITLDNDEAAYIVNDNTKVFACDYCEVLDYEVSGFNYKVKNDLTYSFEQLFTPVPVSPFSIQQKVEDNTVTLKRISDENMEKVEYISFKYDPDLVEVTPFVLYKDDNFFLLSNAVSSNNLPYIEIDDLYGTKGYILKTVNLGSTSDSWIRYAAIFIALASLFFIVFLNYKSGAQFIFLGLIGLLSVGIGFVAGLLLTLFSVAVKSLVRSILIRL